MVKLTEGRYDNELTILCVEDDRICATLIRKFLEQSVSSIKFAENGREGVACFREYAPDVIITDQLMPIMSGLEMIREIRSIDTQIPIILMTSSINEKLLIEAINLGVSKFVPKPIQSTLLRKVLMEIRQELYSARLVEQAHRQELELLRYRDRYHSRQQEMAFRKEQHITRNDLLRQAFAGNVGELWGVDIRCRPQDIMCGDSYTTHSLPDGRLLLSLADAMGAGLSASITSMLVTSHVNYLVDNLLRDENISLELLMRHLGSYLKSILLDDEMLCLGLAIIDLKSEIAHAILFGLPPILAKCADGTVQKINSGNPPFSIYSEETVATHINLHDKISVTIASDGLGETGIKSGGSFRDVMEDELGKTPTVSTFLQRFENLATDERDDLLILHLQRLTPLSNLWCWSETVTEPTLRQTSYMAERCLNELKGQLPLQKEAIDEIELILTESLTNAFEHGCLRLNRGAKDSLILAEEYDTLLESKSVNNESISLTASISSTTMYQLLTLLIEDTGAGFDWSNIRNPDNPVFSGRGLRLVSRYADGIYFHPPGNRIVILKTVEVSQNAD